MPTISMFYGIIIRMMFMDTNNIIYHISMWSIKARGR